MTSEHRTYGWRRPKFRVVVGIFKPVGALVTISWLDRYGEEESTTIIDVGRCRTLFSVQLGRARGSSGLSISDIKPRTTQRQTIARVFDAEIYHPRNPAHALSRLLSTSPRLPSSQAFLRDFHASMLVSPAFYRAQPWFPGRPRAQAGRVMNRSRSGYVLIDGSASEPELVRQVGSYELWSVATPSTINGGHAYIEYDPRANRHRWIWACTTPHATVVHWGPVVDNFLIGYALSQYGPIAVDDVVGDGFVLLNLREGTVHRLRVNDLGFRHDVDRPQTQEDAERAFLQMGLGWTSDGFSYRNVQGGTTTLSLANARSWFRQPTHQGWHVLPSL